MEGGFFEKKIGGKIDGRRAKNNTEKDSFGHLYHRIGRWNNVMGICEDDRNL